MIDACQPTTKDGATVTSGMPRAGMRLRVLYSFPNKLGAGRICWTAWQQVKGLIDAGADVTVIAASTLRQPSGHRKLVRTLCLGSWRIPTRLIGSRRAVRLHDRLTAAWLAKNAASVDLVHAWPSASLSTIREARKHGIPVFLERPNTHTAYAYEAVEEECRLLGMTLPEHFEHKFDAGVLELETKEYEECDYLLCPSPFVEKSFIDRGFPPEKLLRHQYGFDADGIQPGSQGQDPGAGLTVIYAGLCTPRKGLHYALQAWISSKASRNGRFLICGDFVPGYREKLHEWLNHPGIEVLGHRSDLPELMKSADLFVLSTIEEGSALVTYEARGAGCVLVVSDAAGAVCEHDQNGLIHPARDVATLTSHFDRLNADRGELARLRQASIETIDHLTWAAAGSRLLKVYESQLNPLPS